MIDLFLLILLVLCALAVVEAEDILGATIIFGAYSLIMAIVWVRLNAVDVAFTEATVGAGITTVLLIAALARTQRREDCSTGIKTPSDSEVDDKKSMGKPFLTLQILSIFIVVVTGAVLIYGTIDMPDFGDPAGPANHHVAADYIENAYKDTKSLNVVTAILASYRGFDTLGETAVIFTAGLSVILILRRKKRERKGGEDG